MKTAEHYRIVIRSWNATKRNKPIIPLFLFSEGFVDLNGYAKNQKTPIFYSPIEAAFAIKILIERMIFLKKIVV